MASTATTLSGGARLSGELGEGAQNHAGEMWRSFICAGRLVGYGLGMDDFKLYRRSAIRYWEWRRILYNLALVPPAFVGFVICGATSAAAGDVTSLTDGEMIRAFLMSALGANIC